MDEMVQAAMAKWPNVPACYGWLGLDGRGHWYLRDTEAQLAGPFAGDGACAHSRGNRLAHEGLLAFIGRNYASDAQGQWFFQNGPQRVYVELEVAPWVWRLSDQWQLTSHTGLPVEFQAAWLNEEGCLFVETDRGVGLLHSQDMHLAADRVECGAWPLQTDAEWIAAAHRRWVRSPLARQQGCVPDAK